MYLSVSTTSLSIVLKSVIRLQGNESSDTEICDIEGSDAGNSDTESDDTDTTQGF